MKIYLLSSGTYSDYRIEGVFSTQEKAGAAKSFVGDREDLEIEEFTLDETPDYPPGFFPWWVYLDEAGDHARVTRRHWRDDPDSDDACRGETAFPVSARDERHAVKIAHEQWIIRLARGPGFAAATGDSSSVGPV